MNALADHFDDQARRLDVAEATGRSEAPSGTEVAAK
jgi:hypothetical protein